ncbi:TPA: carbon storage regulator [Legionella pneumophila]|jgi:carbon storage regulator|uniref:carbon storage regulator n=1 Tax=Legionella pneumophila TaxID=446 RepID=UPI0009B4777D|nr:carbon storage regulator [Legionella pneumophila]HAT4481970.1 carbon storage regulator [Legionella pneumophila]HAT7841144.1 carbon storage regulator [Legionella pneumophila]HAU0031626.1 carbon storage regulator [Legionella pneumophila]HAU0040820.1 carbon storage regulator [Legionella pneumophila]HAU0061663.1 carbon storage regulator [Legionella pneumophila]
MLILSRKEGESIMISEDICITILKNVDGKVDVGISAPKAMPVHRLEIFEKNKTKANKD